jgi:preprotein translocase subunit YajC
LNPTLLILVLAMGAIWVAFIRPQKRRQQLQRQHQRELLDAIEPGAEVLTAAGLYGTVVETDDDNVRVEIADGVVVKIDRRSIGAVIPPEVEEADEPEEDEAAPEETEGEAAQEPRS